MQLQEHAKIIELCSVNGDLYETVKNESILKIIK